MRDVLLLRKVVTVRRSHCVPSRLREGIAPLIVTSTTHTIRQKCRNSITYIHMHAAARSPPSVVTTGPIACRCHRTSGRRGSSCGRAALAAATPQSPLRRRRVLVLCLLDQSLLLRLALGPGVHHREAIQQVRHFLLALLALVAGRRLGLTATLALNLSIMIIMMVIQ